MKFASLAAAAALAASGLTFAQPAPPAGAVYDAELAAKLKADDYGMRPYVFVVLKTGPKRMPAGPERDEMFKGHFANIGRLAAEGKLAVAGPFDGVDGWRGMYIFAVADIEEAKKLVATDPVVVQGEMVPEFHKLYATAALMLANEVHGKIGKPR